MEEYKMKTLVRKNRFYPVMPSMFDEFFRNDLYDNSNYALQGGSLPSVNVKETDEAFELELAAPGMKKNDFKVELDNNILKISSEKENRKENKEDDYSRREFFYQSFCRSFRLPENKVEAGKITATYKDGILFLSLPKKEEAKVKPLRMIEIG